MSAGTGPGPSCIGSILFTDLVGFTEYNDLVGDAPALAVLEQQTDMATLVVDASPGDARIVKELGDGLMIWFASPTDAVAGATNLLATLDEARSDGTFPLSVRMGLHHGEAVARGDDLIGRTVNLAARISALAGPGELLVSDDVVDALDDRPSDATFQPIGPVPLKGVQDPVWLQRLEV